MRGIWKVCSMVFYLNNRFTNPFMFSIILTEMAIFIWIVMRNTFSLLNNVSKLCDALHYLLGNMFIRFGSKLYKVHLESS